MKPRTIALTALLLSALAAVAWQAKVRWNEDEARRARNINAKVKPPALPPALPAAQPEAVPAVRYADVATNNLFSKDRNPTVVVEPVKVEAPKPMPPFPIVFGVMGLPSGARGLMAEKAGAGAKPVRAGDTVGEFKVIALDTQNVTFEWNGKAITKKVDDLIDRSNPASAPSGPAIVTSAGPAVATTSAPAAAAPPPNAVMGVEVGASGQSRRACKPGDTSAPGAVVDGYKKTVFATPFGETCTWVSVQ